MEHDSLGFWVGMCGLALSSWAINCTAAETYRWVDESNTVIYSDTPPPGKQADKVKLGNNVIQTDTQPFETKEAARKNPIQFFTFPECGEPCEDAKKLLDQRGVPYTVRSTEADKLALQKLTGKLDIPVTIIGQRAPITGFDEARLNRALDDAGYPKSNPFARLKKLAKDIFAPKSKQPSEAVADDKPKTTTENKPRPAVNMLVTAN